MLKTGLIMPFLLFPIYQMPDNAKVFISYGPYEAVGTVEYRESRLQGLKGIISFFFLLQPVIRVLIGPTCTP